MASLSDIPSEIGVVLKTINDETFGVQLPRNALISEVKTKVKVTTAVPEERQRLIYRGRVLEDDKRLSAYNVEDGHTIHLVARPHLQHAATENPPQAQRAAPTEESPRMAGITSLAESLLARGAEAGHRLTEQQAAPDSLEHIRQSMLTAFTLMSTMSTVTLDDYRGEAAPEDTKFSEEMESKESSSPTRYPRRQFYVGQWLDVKDTVDQWLEGTVLDINDGKLLIHYNGWPSRWDEWIEFSSARVAPFRTRTPHVLSTASNCPAPSATVAHAPTTGLNDLRQLLPDMVSMMKMMTARLEELSELYVEHRAYDPESERFNRGGNADTAGNLPWSTAQPLTSSDVPFSSEKEARMTALASELAPLCDRFGRTIVDLAPQLYRLGTTNEETDAPDLEEQSPYHLLSRALGRARGRSATSSASTDRAYRQIITSTARGNGAQGVGNHLDIHIHAILTPTSRMFGAGAASDGTNRASSPLETGTLPENAFRSLAGLQAQQSARADPSGEPHTAASSANMAADQNTGAYRNLTAVRRLFYPQPRSSRTETPVAAPATTTADHTYRPPVPTMPVPQQPQHRMLHDDFDMLAPRRPVLPPRATSDSGLFVGHGATAQQAEFEDATEAGPPQITDHQQQEGADEDEDSQPQRGGGLLRVLRRWSRNFTGQG